MTTTSSARAPADPYSRLNSSGLIDVHAHLGDALFDSDREAVLRRAREAGVTGVITVGETMADAVRILALSKMHPEILPAAGLYPTHLEIDQADEVARFIRDHRKELVAIGEVGLDYWKVQDDGDRGLQREIFARFIDLSLELDLPLNVHSRSAGLPVIELLMQHGAQRVLLHAFDGRAATALPAIEAGYYFSIPPSVVRSRQKQKLVQRLPLSCLLLETDSPALGPLPGERNEPANLPLALRAIADLKRVPEGEVADAVRTNTHRLLSIRQFVD